MPYVLTTTGDSSDPNTAKSMFAAINNSLAQMMSKLDAIRGSSAEQTWKAKIQAISQECARHGAYLDRYGREFAKNGYQAATEAGNLISNWHEQIDADIRAEKLRRATGIYGGFSRPEVAVPEYSESMPIFEITPSEKAETTLQPVTQPIYGQVSPGDLNSLNTSAIGMLYKKQVTSSSNPIAEMSKPAPGREKAFFTSDQILGLVGSLFKGYTASQKAELEAQALAMKAQGQPIQVPKVVAQEVRAQTMPWEMLGLAAFGIIALGVVLYAFSKPSASEPQAVRMLTGGGTKLLPAPS